MSEVFGEKVELRMRAKVWVCDDEGSARFPVFTRGNVGEVFSEAVSPLTWSTYGAALRGSSAGATRSTRWACSRRTSSSRPAQCEIVGCFGGYVYINASVNRVMAVRIPGLTIEAIDQSFFGDYPHVPPYRPDPRDGNAERTAAVGAWLASLFTTDPKPRHRSGPGRASTRWPRKRPDFASAVRRAAARLLPLRSEQTIGTSSSGTCSTPTAATC